MTYTPRVCVHRGLPPSHHPRICMHNVGGVLPLGHLGLLSLASVITEVADWGRLEGVSTGRPNLGNRHLRPCVSSAWKMSDTVPRSLILHSREEIIQTEEVKRGAREMLGKPEVSKSAVQDNLWILRNHTHWDVFLGSPAEKQNTFQGCAAIGSGLVSR